MEFSAQYIANILGGQIVGNPDAKVNDFAKIEEGRPGCLSFLYNNKYEDYLYTTQSSVILVNNDFEPKKEYSATLIKVADARLAVAQLLNIYESMKPRKRGIHPLSFVATSAQVDESCYVGPFACIGENVVIGKDTIINPNVVIYDGCKIGERCILHAGCVIGADGFGFQPNAEKTGYDKIPQIGIVIIEDDVEIGANTCIDRAMMGATIIHKDVKLDNLVQIGHNNDIGAHTVMSSQVGIAGTTKIGEWCMFGGQVGVAGQCSIANRTMVGAQSGIPNNIKKEGQQLMGYPALDGKKWWRSNVVFKNLPELDATVTAMKKQIAELQAQIEELKK